jgi:hypothetical protein
MNKKDFPVDDFTKLYANIRNYNTIKDAPNYEFVSRLLDTEANDVSLTFFSEENILLLNNNIISEVLEISKNNLGKAYRIQPQQREKMLTVMRYIYFAFVTNTYELSVEVQRLNEKFLQEVVPTAYNALVAHLKYLETYNRTNNVPINNPENTQRDKVDLRPLSSLFDF